MTSLNDGSAGLGTAGSVEAPLLKTTRYTGTALLEATFEEPRWIVPGLLVEGLNVTAGVPKIGKSTLKLQLAAEIVQGGEFLGRELEPAVVALISYEDPPRRLQSRLLELGLTAPGSDNLYVFCDWPDLGIRKRTEVAPGPGMKELERLARGLPLVYQDNLQVPKPALIVIDTLGRAIPGGVDHNDYGMMTKLLGDMQSIATSDRVAIDVVDHHGKGRRNRQDPVADIMGSTGKGGAADSVWGLYKQGGRITLDVVGRDMERTEIRLARDGLRFVEHRDARDAEAEAADQEFIEALKKLDEPATSKAIAELLGKDDSTIRSRAKKLHDSGLISRVGTATTGFRYRVRDVQPFEGWATEDEPFDPWGAADE